MKNKVINFQDNEKIHLTLLRNYVRRELAPTIITLYFAIESLNQWQILHF